MLIGVGVMLLWRAIEARREVELPPSASPTQLREWSIFGGGERQFTTHEFQGGEVLAIFGGWGIDLTRADIKQNEAVIEANCIFGGVEIRVPEAWNVTVRGVGVFGGYGDKTRHPRGDEMNQAKQLVIRGTAVFGGVEIKN